MSKSYKLCMLFLSVLFVLYAALISSKAVAAALISSLDMQWFPSLQFFGLLHERAGELEDYVENPDFLYGDSGAVNPYQAFIDDLEDENQFLCQAPQYLHLLYVLMWPFANLSFFHAKMSFAIFSIFCFLFSVLISVVYSRFKNLAIVFGILTLGGYSLSNVVANGQYTCILGLFTLLAFMARKNPILMSLALSFVLIKHSFGLPIALAFFLLGYWRGVVLSVIIWLGVVVLYDVRFGGGILYNLLLPFAVNKSLLGTIGPHDLMSVMSYVMVPGVANSYVTFAAVCASYAVYTTFVFCRTRACAIRGDSVCEPQIIASSIVFSLFSTYHLGYDSYMLYIVLVFLLMSNRLSRSLAATLGCTTVIFLGDRVLKALGYHLQWATSMGLPFTAVVTALLALLTFMLVADSDS